METSFFGVTSTMRSWGTELDEDDIQRQQLTIPIMIYSFSFSLSFHFLSMNDAALAAGRAAALVQAKIEPKSLHEKKSFQKENEVEKLGQGYNKQSKRCCTLFFQWLMLQESRMSWISSIKMLSNKLCCFIKSLLRNSHESARCSYKHPRYVFEEQ